MNLFSVLKGKTIYMYRDMLLPSQPNPVAVPADAGMITQTRAFHCTRALILASVVPAQLTERGKKENAQYLPFKSVTGVFLYHFFTQTPF